MSRKWREVLLYGEDGTLVDRLNRLEEEGYTIFQIIPRKYFTSIVCFKDETL